MLAGTRQHHPNRRARCNAAPAHHLHAHATPAAEGRNSTPLGNAQDSRHVEFRYPAPRRAWREVRSQRRPPLALRRPSSCQAVLPESEGGGFLDLYPHRGSLCRISSVVDPAGPADSMFSTLTRARLLIMPRRARGLTWNPPEERTSARLFWPLRSGRWCLLVGDPSLSAAGHGTHLRSVLGKTPVRVHSSWSPRHASVSRLFTSGRNPWVLPHHSVRKAVV